MEYELIYSRQNAINGGFTLVETLVSITILLLVIIAPISIAARGLQLTYYAGDELTALFLAQEGTEAIISYRDETALNTLADPGEFDVEDWSADRSGNPIRTCLNANGCKLSDVHDNEYENCSSGNGSACELRYDSGTMTYGYDTGNPSGFTRVIKVDTISAGEALIETQLTKTVNSPFSTIDVKLHSWVYNHYNRFDNP